MHATQRTSVWLFANKLPDFLEFQSRNSLAFERNQYRYIVRTPHKSTHTQHGHSIVRVRARERAVVIWPRELARFKFALVTRCIYANSVFVLFCLNGRLKTAFYKLNRFFSNEQRTKNCVCISEFDIFGLAGAIVVGAAFAFLLLLYSLNWGHLLCLQVSVYVCLCARTPNNAYLSMND